MVVLLHERYKVEYHVNYINHDFVDLYWYIIVI